MLNYLIQISNESYRLVKETVSPIFDAIFKKLEKTMDRKLREMVQEDSDDD